MMVKRRNRKQPLKQLSPNHQFPRSGSHFEILKGDDSRGGADSSKSSKQVPPSTQDNSDSVKMAKELQRVLEESLASEDQSPRRTSKQKAPKGARDPLADLTNKQLCKNLKRKDGLIQRLANLKSRQPAVPNRAQSSEETAARRLLEKTLWEEEMFRLQNARTIRIANGDRNTRFFHNSTLKRRCLTESPNSVLVMARGLRTLN
ncbi:hypothetical protein LINPERHAP2_LOCUS40345 [Linum perenne]